MNTLLNDDKRSHEEEHDGEAVTEVVGGPARKHYADKHLDVHNDPQQQLGPGDGGGLGSAETYSGGGGGPDLTKTGDGGILAAWKLMVKPIG
jgi:hypothetical protein